MILYIEAQRLAGTNVDSKSEKVTCHLCGETYIAKDMWESHEWVEQHNEQKHKEDQ